MTWNRAQKTRLLRSGAPLVRALSWLSRTNRARLHKPPRRILVVRLDAIGDVLLSEPALRALRAAWPAAQIDVLVGRGPSAILNGHPDVRRVWTYDAPWQLAWRGQRVDRRAAIRESLGLARRLRRQRYDLALELRGDVRDAAVAALAAPRWLVGLNRRGADLLLDQPVATPPDTHSVESALRVVAAASHARPTGLVRPQLYLSAPEQARAALLVAHLPRPRLALHVGAGFAHKRLPIATWAAALRELATVEHGCHLVLVGGSEDRPLVDRLLASLRADAASPLSVTDLVGRLSVRETAAALAHCDLFLGTDSAPMHLAAAVGTPVVAVFGPSWPSVFHPWDVPYRLVENPQPCRGCDLVHCVQGRPVCVEGIRPEQVVAAAQALWPASIGGAERASRAG